MAFLKTILQKLRGPSEDEIHQECVFYYFLHANEISRRRRETAVSISEDVSNKEFQEILLGAIDNLISKYSLSRGEASRIAREAFLTFAEMQPK